MRKNIVLDIEFPEGFVPPEKFDDPALNKDFNSKCDQCPFFMWDEEQGFGCCAVLDNDPKTFDCPIKKQF